MEYSDARIVVFTRAPIAGQVKTRLIPALGEERATSLHAKLANRMIECALGCQLAPVVLACDPDEHAPFFDAFRHKASMFAQQGQDIGERMHHALASCLNDCATSAILMGTDCPTIDAAYLRSAIVALTDTDAVIGPAEDGGYGLIGLRRPEASLFRGIAWGTSTVCAETCRRFTENRLQFELLPQIWDVDRPEDVMRYERWGG